MKTKLLFLIGFFCLSLFVIAQEDNDTVITVGYPHHKEMSENRRIFYKNKIAQMNIDYKIPNKFQGDTIYYRITCQKMSFAFSDFFNIFGRAYSFLKSKDDEMVVFLSLDTIADANKEKERSVVDNLTYL